MPSTVTMLARGKKIVLIKVCSELLNNYSLQDF